MLVSRRAAVLLLLCVAALGVAGALAAFFFGTQLEALASVRFVPWAAMALLSGLLVAPSRSELVERWTARLDGLSRQWGVMAIALVAIALLAWKLLQHLSFWTGAYDLSIYQHAIDNTLHGRFMVPFGGDRSFLFEHRSLLLLLWVPIYALAPSVYTLLVLQALAVTATGVVLFLLARAHELSRLESALVALAFWVSPVVWRGFIFDVHPELWGPLFAFLAMWAAAKNRWPVFYLALVLLFSIKEDHPLTGLALAVWLALYRKDARRHAAAAVVLSLGWMVLALKLGPENPFLGARYGHLGATLPQVAWTLISHPLDTLALLLGRPARAVLGSLGLGAVLNPVAVVLSVPHLLLNRASNWGAQQGLVDYYGLPAWTIVMATVPALLARIKLRWGHVAAVCVALTLFAPAMTDVGPRPLHWPSSSDRDAARAIERLDLRVRTEAQTQVVPHLPVHPNLHLWEGGLEAPVIVLTPAYHALVFPNDELRRRVRDAFDAGYGASFSNETLLILERPGPGRFDVQALERINRAP